MAKRRKTKKSGSRRRVGAATLNANNPIVKFGSPVAGFVFAQQINSQVDKLVGDKLDAKIQAGLQIVPGAWYLFMKKGKKNPWITILLGLLAGAGIKKGMAAFGIAGPYGRVPVVAGPYGRVPVVARVGQGYTPNQALNGYSPNQSLNRVMAGVYPGSGSGMTADHGSEMKN